jgi:hypothetical protein
MASDIYYSSNPAEWTQLEGVYISEEAPAGLVEGVDFNTVGIAGRCVRGPLVPTLVTSPARFAEVFGGRALSAGGALYGEVWRALLGKQFGPVVVRRVAAADAVFATHSFSDATTPVLKVDASSVGSWGNQATAAVEAASDADATHFNLRVAMGGREALAENVNLTGTADTLALAFGDDDGVIVHLSKLAPGRPVNVTATPLTGGTDGAVASAEYIAAVTDLAHVDGVDIVLAAEASPTHATLNAAIISLAATVPDKVFLIWSGVHGNTPAQEATAKAAQCVTTPDRVFWFYNSAKVIDPETATKIDAAPHTFAASILSQNDVDVHIGAIETLKQTASVVALRNEALTRGDLIMLRKAGICSFEKQKRGFRFRSALAVDARTRLVDRRQRDWLQISASEFLAAFVDSKNTVERRALMAGGLATFSGNLQDQRRVVEAYKVNANITSDGNRALGIEEILWAVRLIGHIEFLVFRTNIGTGVVIEQAAA